MIPYMFCVMERLRMNEEQFFMLSHYWRFKRQVHPVQDIVNWKQTGELPKYVVEYLHFLQGNEEFIDPKPTALTGRAERIRCLKTAVLDALVPSIQPSKS